MFSHWETPDYLLLHTCTWSYFFFLEWLRLCRSDECFFLIFISLPGWLKGIPRLWQDLFMWDKWARKPFKRWDGRLPDTLTAWSCLDRRSVPGISLNFCLHSSGQLSNDFQRCPCPDPWNLCHLKWQRAFVGMAKDFTVLRWSERPDPNPWVLIQSSSRIADRRCAPNR